MTRTINSSSARPSVLPTGLALPSSANASRRSPTWPCCERLVVTSRRASITPQRYRQRHSPHGSQSIRWHSFCHEARSQSDKRRARRHQRDKIRIESSRSCWRLDCGIALGNSRSVVPRATAADLEAHRLFEGLSHIIWLSGIEDEVVALGQ